MTRATEFVNGDDHHRLGLAAAIMDDRRSGDQPDRWWALALWDEPIIAAKSLLSPIRFQTDLWKEWVSIGATATTVTAFASNRGLLAQPWQRLSSAIKGVPDASLLTLPDRGKIY